MATITLSEILDDLRIADQALRKFEQRYWISSEVFFDFYSRGLLDDGANAEDFAEWAGHYKLKLKRQEALERLSRRRIEQLQHEAHGGIIALAPQEPVLELA
jgi:hypothetical protein